MEERLGGGNEPLFKLSPAIFEGLAGAEQPTLPPAFAESLPATETDETYTDPDDPTEKVEMFLADSASVFAESRSTWRAVRQTQSKIIGSDQNPLSELVKLNFNMNREARRDPVMRVAISGDRAGLVTEIQKNAQNWYFNSAEPRLYQKYPKDKNARRDALNIMLEESTIPSLSQEPGEPERQLFGTINTLHRNMAIALYLDNELAERVENFLSDPVVIQPFVDRIEALAQDSFRGQHEFPGLLEAFAVHVKRDGPTNILSEAMKRVSPDPSELSADFIQTLLKDQEGGKKLQQSLDAIVFAAKILVKTEADDNGEWRTDVAERFAGQYGSWPKWLQQELKIYATREHNAKVQALTNSLDEYNSPGRLARMSLVKQRAPKKVPGGKIQVGDNRKHLQDIYVPQPETGNSREVRPPVITSFATFKNSGGLKDRLTPEECDGLDGLFGSSVIQDYLKKYQHDQNLPGAMRKGLTFLTENCFDQTLTRPMVRAIYTLNGNKQNRTMRRLRLRDFSGVNRDSVADNTRILYDILRDTTGKPQLALYGIFYKQDIENIRSLPPR